jgi:hypothetical protein
MVLPAKTPYSSLPLGGEGQGGWSSLHESFLDRISEQYARIYKPGRMERLFVIILESVANPSGGKLDDPIRDGNQKEAG